MLKNGNNLVNVISRNIFIVLVPFLFMIIVNELVRPTIKERPYSQQGVTAMNSAQARPDKCTWNCHNATGYCKEHHVKYVSKHFKLIDPYYSGMIYLLRSTGNYGLANIIFLVILWPALMFYLFIRVSDMKNELKRLK